MFTVEADKPYESAGFTVHRTGLEPGYEQTVSNVKFDIENLTPISTPPIIVRFPPHTNTGDGEMHFSIDYTSTMKKTSTWTWEKGKELTNGAKITASLKIPGDVATIGSDVSTEIKTTTKNTNTYAEEKEEAVTLNEYVQVPPHTRVSAELILTEDRVNVPYTALVTVTTNKGNKTYSYPINGTFLGTRFFNIALNSTKEPLNQTAVMKSSMRMPEVRPVATTTENNTTTYMFQSGNSTIGGA